MSDIVADAGRLLVADDGTALPTDVATSWGTDIGNLAKDGLGLASDPQIAELFSFGYTDPTRTRKTREVKRFTARLQKWNTSSFTLAFNGGTVTVAAGIATYVPEDDTTLVPKALVWEFENGSYIYRLCFTKVEVRSGTQMDFSDEDYTVLPLDVTVLKPTSGSPWKLVTNDPDFTATP